MKNEMLHEVAKMEKKHKIKRMWLRVVSCLAAVVVFGTTYALILPAITMEREVICGIEDHEHTEECYATEDAEQDTGQVASLEESGETAHSHVQDCMDDEGNFVCGYTIVTVEETTEEVVEETTEDAEPLSTTETFTYSDGQIDATVEVISATEIPADTQMVLAAMGSDSDSYALYADYAAENLEGELTGLAAYEISFVSGETELDISDAEMKVQIAVKEVAGAGDGGVQLLTAEAGEESEEAGLVQITSLQMQEGQVSSGDTVEVDAENAAQMVLTLNGASSFALSKNVQALPKFEVQYYANVYRYSTTGDATIPIINTDGTGDPNTNTNGQGGTLPVNRGNTSASPTDRQIYNFPLRATGTTDSAGNQEYKLAMELQPTEIYEHKEAIIYSNSMTIEDLNVLADNTHYRLDFIRTQSVEQKAEQDAAGVTELDERFWTKYEFTDADPITNYYFTNDPNAAEKDGKAPLVITDGMTVRYVYQPTSGRRSADTKFFDYDISDGKTPANTQSQGINSAGNYGGTGTKLAFGNANTGTNLQNESWTDSNGVANTLNKYNSSGYLGCTFGLVTGYNYAGDGSLIYADGIIAPHLFTYDPGETGKTTYSGSTMNFVREGDTYTLSSASGTDNISAADLDIFTQRVFNTKTLYSNDFWPMDNIYNTDKHFGDGVDEWTYDSDGTGKNFPASDDKLEHNSYFGLQYAVEFHLDGSYTGPLEYLFYGDDDMWVFLTDITDPDNPRTRMICDIGGVHSSVGSYTNLWDWVTTTEDRPNGKGNYVLSFFYTERGASGSSCFMQFTIPDAINVPITDVESGSLRVGKQLAEDSDNTTTNQSFVFEYELSLGNKFFPYTIYDKNNAVVSEGSVLGKGNFELKAGEYIIISDIPFGTTYKVSEISGDYTVQWKENETVLNTNEPSGTINEQNPALYLECINQFSHLTLTKKVDAPEDMGLTEDFQFTLQLKDSSGNALTGSYPAIKTDAANQQTSSSLTFDEQGTAVVTLKKDESITIYNLPNNATWQVTEKEVDGFVTSYTIVDGIQPAERTVDGNMADGKLQAGDNIVTCTNATSYELPDTGGVGTNLYTIGGLAMIALAAGLWYKTRRRKEDLASF